MIDVKEEIKAEVEGRRYGGRYCVDCTNKLYYVVGAVDSGEDYYYIGINGKRQICFLSCIGGLNAVDLDDDILNDNINDFSVLNYLIKYEPETIAYDVKQYIAKTNDKLFTKININGKLY